MKKRTVKKLLLLAFLTCQSAFGAPAHVVTLFVNPYPTDHIQLHKVDESNPKNRKKVAENKDFKDSLYQSAKEKSKGIFFTYFGYKTFSNNDGQVTFPLKTQQPSFYLLVTSEIKPIFMLYNTIAHWQVKNHAKYTFFSIDRKYDEKTKLHFWSVEQLKIPNNLEIPINTIVMHADPKNVYVPTGITITSDSPQLILPQILVKPEIERAYNAIEFLENGEFFAPIDRTFKVDLKTKESKV